MVLFSTPYRSQRLYVRIGSKHHFKYDVNNSSSPSVSGKQPQLSPKSHANISSSDVQRRLLESVSLKANHDHRDMEVDIQAEIIGSASIKRSKSLQRTFSTSKGVDTSILELTPHLLPFQAQTLTQEFSAKLVRRLLLHDGDQDGSIGSPAVFATYGREKDRRGTSQRVVRSLLGGTAAAAAAAGPLSVGEGLYKISDHEVLLTGLTDFGFVSAMLADQPLTSHKPTPPPANTGGNANTTTAAGGAASTPAQNKTTTDGEFMVSIAIGETVLPGKFKALQSTAQPPSLRLPPAVQWGNTTSTPSTSRPPAGGATAAQECQYLGQLHVATKHSSSSSSSSSVGPVPDLSADATGGTVTAVGDETSPAVAQGKNRNKTTVARHAKLEPVVALGGELSSGACGKTISFEANSFSLEVSHRELVLNNKTLFSSNFHAFFFRSTL